LGESKSEAGILAAYLSLVAGLHPMGVILSVVEQLLNVGDQVVDPLNHLLDDTFPDV
jgi:hypothetical protein